MAGIAGFIPFNDEKTGCSEDQFGSIMEAMKFQTSQPSVMTNKGGLWLGVAGRVNESEKEIFSGGSHTICVFEGDLRIEEEARKKVLKDYPNLTSVEQEEKLLPYLFNIYGAELPHKLTGNFNICCYNAEDQTALIFNGRFGMLPLFYFMNDRFLVFSSKLAGIVRSGLIDCEWDTTTQLEQIIFNYPLSDSTFIKNVRTLQAGSMFFVRNGKTEKKTYWSVQELFGKSPLNKKEGFENVYNALAGSVRNFMAKRVAEGLSTGLSLTGGWDGRLVLSYLLKEGLDKNLFLYSFGADGSTDVTIPEAIARDMKIDYTAVILDDDYISNHFISNAFDTIRLSSGQRPFLRTHYLFTMKLLSERTRAVLSGNCGSNILKYGVIRPGTVVNKNLLTLIEQKFNKNFNLHLFNRYRDLFHDDQNVSEQEFLQRISSFGATARESGSLSEFYFSVLLSRVERKFFGTEINSYNDFVLNYSPFIDYHFINTLSQTIYWGPNYPFNSSSLQLRKLSTDLYSRIIRINSPFLWNAKTDRDVSFKDLATIAGKVKILRKKFFSSQTQPGKFNTGSLMDLFLSESPIKVNEMLNREEKANFLSTEYFKKSLKQS
jgi:asparagine synthetase B (glutamine-hydrolysing)